MGGAARFVLAASGHVAGVINPPARGIERCRTVALGGHVARCEDCAHTVIAYNSCLMGKFRNGESAGGRAADPADSQMIANDFSAHSP